MFKYLKISIVTSLVFMSQVFAQAHFYDFKQTPNDSLRYFDASYEDPSWKEYTLNSQIRDSKRNEYVYWVKFKFDVEDIDLDDPAIFLGLIGDIDITYVNGYQVGKTGNISGKSKSYYHVPRLYRIPKQYLKKTGNIVQIRAKKKSILNAGIHLGDVRFGEHDELSVRGSKANFYIFYLNVIMAFFSFFIGIYHLYLYFRIPEKKQNLYYFVFSCFSSLFILSLGWVFANQVESARAVVLINSILGISTAVSYFIFIQTFLQVQYTIYHKVFIALNILFAILIIFQSDYMIGFQYYSLWYLVGLSTILYAATNIFKSFYYHKRKDLSVLLISILIMFVTVVCDVLSSLSITSMYQVSSIGFFMLNVGILIALAYDFTDAYVNIETLVTDRTEDLSVALSRLKDLEQMKDKFFANISHDFKTPIAVAMGSLDEIKRETLPSATIQRHAIGAAERSLKKLLSMVGDLLNLIKAESGTLKMDWQLVNPAELLESWLDTYQILAKKKKLKLNLKDMTSNGFQIPMDISKFERVMQNLLSNAIKFTEYDKNKANKIEVQCKSDAAWYYIEVHDSGMGIPDDEKPMVFERYYQTTKTSLKQHGGSGIGLSFVKEMVDKQNGHINVKDSDYGGVKFVITLPLKQNVEVTGSYQVLKNDEGEEISHSSMYVEYPRLKPKKIDEGKFTLLVAEDNPEVAHITLAALEDEFNVYMAENGYDALEFLKENDVDCLVTDIVMPKMRGEELVRKVRQLEKTLDLPILVLSSQSDENIVIGLIKEGANDYVTKPFKREILRARVFSQIEKHKSSQWISQNEKVIELGLLASGMAHQIRNGLHSMKNQISYYEKTAERMSGNMDHFSPQQKEKMISRLVECNNMMTRALDRIDSLTASVNAYALSSKEMVEISLLDSLSLMKELLADKITKSAVQLDLDQVPNLRIMGYTSFHEIFINLFGNAMDACAHDGTGKISMTVIERKDDLKIEIIDNGQGIKKELLNKLCQPFFTTKSPDKGTGLGLYVVRDIIQGQHGGKLSIYSDGIGKGSRFVIEVPKVAKMATQDADIVMHGHKV